MTTIGDSFLDRAGQQWLVKGLRPGSTDQLVVEAQMHGSYPRIALYVMTANEFEVHARAADPWREAAPARTSRPGDRPR